MGRSQELYKYAKQLIPGGTQLLSKRPEMLLPELWPAYYEKAKGCEVWDLDGKKYLDMSFMGIGACALGYADDDVDAAVKDAVSRSNMCTLNSPDEVELAELLIELHTWAKMVRYARSGGEAMAVAVRIARAASKRDVVLFCGYHGWHDWYLSANLASDSSLDGHLIPGLSTNGVPRSLKGTSLPFVYNDTASFLRLVKENKGNIGAIVLESIRNHAPDKEFVAALRQTATAEKIPLIVDEITAGWRLNVGGAHLLFGLEPDIAVFGKALSNGFPMAAIIGRGSVMQAAQESFISSTYWTDRIGPAAALATLKKFRKNNVPQHLIKIGKMVKDAWQVAAEKNGVPIEVDGIDPLGHFGFKHEKPLVLKTLFTQEMLARGIMALTAFYASYAHQESHVREYAKAADESFAVIAQAIRSGKPEKQLKGPVCHSGFKRLT